jgi:hypothetical protein
MRLAAGPQQAYRPGITVAVPLCLPANHSMPRLLARKMQCNAACWPALLAALLSACSTQQAYYAGQAWQHDVCRKLPAAQQQRCLASHAMTYEEYQREAAAARRQ